jgi:hypothetical protein
MATLIQSKSTLASSTFEELSVTLDTTPIVGNTLIMWAAERLDPAIITRGISGSNWTEHFYTSPTTDLNFRRQFWVYTKIVEVSEPLSVTVTFCALPAQNIAGRIVLEEWEGLGPLIDVITNETPDIENLLEIPLSNNKNYPAGSNIIAGLTAKMADASPGVNFFVTWSNGFVEASRFANSDVNRMQFTSSIKSLEITESLNTKANIGGGLENYGLSAAALVFAPKEKLVGHGPHDGTPNFVDTRNLQGGMLRVENFTATNTGIANTINIFISDAGASSGEGLVLSVYDYFQNLLAQGVLEDTSNLGWNAVVLDNLVAITSGQVYRLGFGPVETGYTPDLGIDINVSSGWDSATGLTYPILPDPFVKSTGGNTSSTFIYLTGTDYILGLPRLVQNKGWSSSISSARPSLTLDAAPTIGNRLIIVVAHRGDATDIPATMHINDTPGSDEILGWEVLGYHHVALTDSTYRRGFTVLSRIVDGTEGNSFYPRHDVAPEVAIIEEWQNLSGKLIGFSSNDNGLILNETVLSTGTVSNIQKGSIGYSVGISKNATGNPSSDFEFVWDNNFDFANKFHAGTDFRNNIGTGILRSTPAGNLETTATLAASNTQNTGLIAGLLVFAGNNYYTDFSELPSTTGIPDGWTFPQEYLWNDSAWAVQDSVTSGGKFLINDDTWGSTAHIWLSNNAYRTSDINKIFVRLSTSLPSGTNRGKNGVIWRAAETASNTTSGYVVMISKEGGEHYIALKKLTTYSFNQPVQAGVGVGHLAEVSFTELGFDIADHLTDFVNIYVEDVYGYFKIYAWQDGSMPDDPIITYDDSAFLLEYNEVGLFLGQISGDDVHVWDVFSFATGIEEIQLPKPELLGYLDITLDSALFPTPSPITIDVPEGTTSAYMYYGAWAHGDVGYVTTLEGQEFSVIEHTPASGEGPYPANASLQELKNPPTGTGLTLNRTYVGTPLEGVITYIFFVRNGRIRDSALFDIGDGTDIPSPSLTIKSSENDLVFSFAHAYASDVWIDNAELWSLVIDTPRTDGRPGVMYQLLSPSTSSSASVPTSISYSSLLMLSLAPISEDLFLLEDLDNWTPEVIKDQALLWLDAADASTLNLNEAGDIVLWFDKSTNNYDVSQLNPTHCPTPVSNALNNKTVLEFDGVDDFLESRLASSFNLYTGDLSAFIVAKYNTLTPDATHVLLGTSRESSTIDGRWMLSREGSNNSLIAFADLGSEIVVPSNLTFTSTDWNIIGGTIDRDVEVALYLNGTKSLYSSAINNTTNYQANLRFLIGASESSYNSETAHSAVSIAEIVLLRDVDDNLRQKIEGYLAHKWGLTTNLPIEHPYKFIPPNVAGFSIPNISSISFPVIFNGLTGLIITGTNFGS